MSIEDVLGQVLQALRLKRGLTQRDVQKLTRMSRTYLCRLEHGKPTPRFATLEVLAAAYRTTVSEIIKACEERCG